MSEDLAISVENLSKCYHIYEKPSDRFKQMLFGARKQFYREFWAIKDLSFEVKKGETVGIIGQNGSGKSTLLQMICGTLNPTSGSVKVNGRISALLELGSGFNPEFTGKENVYLNASILGLTKDEIDRRYDEIVAFADIGDFIHQPVKTYSSGMYVRLAFAVNALVDPDIFVIDEALAVGDEKFQKKCFSHLEKLKVNGSSIIFVSHNSTSIVELCDKTLLLYYGERLFYGEPSKAIRAYQRLIYSPIDDRKLLIKEYRIADQPDKFNGRNIDKTNTITLIDNLSKEVFDDELTPESILAYPAQGAEIESIQLHDIYGKNVNILQQGAHYEFKVIVNFKESFSGVYFGIHIRNKLGSVITGQRYPEDGVFFDNAQAGSRVLVTFTFKMNLLSGSYFVGGGIWSNQEPHCLNRILDVAIFRVLPSEKQNSFGYVDMMMREPSFELL